MYKLITSTWGHGQNYNIENTVLFKTFAKYNGTKNFVNFHFDRGHYNQAEAIYNQKLGTQSEFILYKIDLLRSKVESLDTKYVVFCDANDVFCTGNIDHLFELFDLDNNIIFSSERNDWPKDYMVAHWPNYRNYNQYDRQNRMFLNSGVQVAKKEKYLELLTVCMHEVEQNMLQQHGGDQGIFTWHYNMNNNPKIVLDYANIFSLSTYDSRIEDYYKVGDRIYSQKYGTSPLFIHDSGSNYGGQKFAERFGIA